MSGRATRIMFLAFRPSSVPPVVLLIALTLAAVLALAVLFRQWDRRLLGLRVTGTRLDAQVVDLRAFFGGVDAMVSGTLALSRIVAKWRDPLTGEVYTFESDAVPCEVWQRYPIGSQVDVYVDPGDFAAYFVDLR